MQIICTLNNKGRMRYNELRKNLDGISNTVLANALKELEEKDIKAKLENGVLTLDVAKVEAIKKEKEKKYISIE